VVRRNRLTGKRYQRGRPRVNGELWRNLRPARQKAELPILVNGRKNNRSRLSAATSSSPHDAQPTACDGGYGRPFGYATRGPNQRQGCLPNKAHREPLRSPRCKTDLANFARHPTTRQGLTDILSMTRSRFGVTPSWTCPPQADLPAFGGEDHPASRPIRWRLEAAPTGFLLPAPTARGEGRPCPRGATSSCA
jgi:hypothetical protein